MYSKLCFVKPAPMRSRYQVSGSAQAHFVTATIAAWLPMFTKAFCCDIIVDSLAYCRAHEGLEIYAGVILDNHLHAILSAPDLSQVLADFKRHTARRLLEALQAEGCEWLLNQLHYYRAKHKAESAYQVWQEGSHPQACLSDAIMQRKLEYMHNNPVKRGHGVAPEHWRYSSAREWCPGDDGATGATGPAGAVPTRSLGTRCDKTLAYEEASNRRRGDNYFCDQRRCVSPQWRVVRSCAAHQIPGVLLVAEPRWAISSV